MVVPEYLPRGRRAARGLGPALAAAVIMVSVAACAGGGVDGAETADDTAPSDSSGGGSPTDTAAPTDDAAVGFDLVAAAAAPVDDVDFDGLYRSLDAVRVEADQAEDPVLMASVSTDAARQARLAAEAADTGTSWDTSERTYTVDSVEVFQVVDEDTVLLSVIDTVAGTRYRRDAAGAVVEERTRPDPSLRFLVLVERRGGTWKIAYDVLGLPAGDVLPAFTRFEPVASTPVGELEVTLSVAANDDGLNCFLVSAPGHPAQVGCAFDSGTDQSALYLFRGPDGAFEALVPLHTMATATAAGRVDPGLTVPVDRQLGTWRFGFVAAEAGLMESFVWEGLDPPDGGAPIVLDGIRAGLRPGEPVLV